MAFRITCWILTWPVLVWAHAELGWFSHRLSLRSGAEHTQHRLHQIQNQRHGDWHSSVWNCQTPCHRYWTLKFVFRSNLNIYLVLICFLLKPWFPFRCSLFHKSSLKTRSVMHTSFWLTGSVEDTKDFDPNAGRFVRYQFTPAFLRLRQVGAT